MPAQRTSRGPVTVNDIHSRLNPTRVRRVVRPESVAALQDSIRDAASSRVPVSIAGGRHAMGGQQFGTGTVLIDTGRLDGVLALDAERGVVDVEAGIRWPGLLRALQALQAGSDRPWGILQKQTGADRLSIGGALAANAHGRGLTYRPMVQDVESFVLVGPDGTTRRCSRHQNPELFSLAIGGYGCFGVIATIRLRLARRRKVERLVEILDVGEVMPAFRQRIADGFLYGDFQYAIAADSRDFLRRGVFSCYRPVDDATPMPTDQRTLSERAWLDLAVLSHSDKQEAFESYADYYLSTSGQIHWSDSHQLSYYMDDYHQVVSRRLGSSEEATEMITELYVPRESLPAFMSQARRSLRQRRADVIYGTVRLVEADRESFLAWAREPWACVIFNLHVVHTPDGLERVRETLRDLIDLAIGQGGSYYLTYHRWASRRQVEACYPQMPEFLRLKRAHDPEERFQSDWYRHYREMFADGS